MKTGILLLIVVCFGGMGFLSHKPKTYCHNKNYPCDSFFVDLAKGWKYDSVARLYRASSAFEKWDYRKCFEGYSQKDLLNCLGEPSIISLDSQIFCYNTYDFYGAEFKFKLKKFDIKNRYHQAAASCRQIRFVFDSLKKFKVIGLDDQKDIDRDSFCPVLVIASHNYEQEIKRRWSYNEKFKFHIWQGDEFMNHLDVQNGRFAGMKLSKEDILRLFGNTTAIFNSHTLVFRIYSVIPSYGLDGCKGRKIDWRIVCEENEVIKYEIMCAEPDRIMYSK